MNNMTKQIAAIALLAIASAPAYSMNWTDEAVNDSVITPSPLMQKAQDALWGSQADATSDMYMPIANDQVADLNDSEGGYGIQ